MAGVLCVGVAVQDMVFSLDEFPAQPDKYLAKDFTSVGGGCAANAAVAVARLGGAAMLGTRLGRDPTGDMIVSALQGEGVDCSHVQRYDGARSPVSAVLVDKAGERMIIAYRDPDLPDDPDWIPDPPPAGISALLADTRWPAGANALARIAVERGMPCVLDAEAPIAGCGPALATASHAAFSAQGMRDHGLRDGETPAGFVARLAGEHGNWVCVTDGASGVWWADKAGSGHVPAFELDVVDTLGAGDVWHGAFALALGEGMGEPDAIRFANATAAIKCTRFGGRAGIPSRSEVEEFLAAH